MRTIAIAFMGTAAVTSAFAVPGCSGSSKEAARPRAPTFQVATAAHHHAGEGPHGGHLIELGDEAYHAELVSTGAVTVYILDASAEKAVAIDARELTINLKHGGKPEQFKLDASPDAGDPQGRSSRFVSEDQELGEDLDAEGADARLVVRIGGRSYAASVKHDHDHGDEHDHDHGADHEDDR